MLINQGSHTVYTFVGSDGTTEAWTEELSCGDELG